MRTTQNTIASTIHSGSAPSIARRRTEAKTARIAVATMMQAALIKFTMEFQHAL